MAISSPPQGSEKMLHRQEGCFKHTHMPLYIKKNLFVCVLLCPIMLCPPTLGWEQLADRAFNTWGDYVMGPHGYTWTPLQTLQEMPTFSAPEHHLLLHWQNWKCCSHGSTCRKDNYHEGHRALYFILDTDLGWMFSTWDEPGLFCFV